MILRIKKPRNASSSAMGTVTTAPTVRNTSHRIRPAVGSDASPAAIGLWVGTPENRSRPSQSANTAMPASAENQPKRQSSSAYFDRKYQSVIPAASTRSGYSHSKPAEAAVEIIPAAMRTTKGIKYAAVGFVMLDSVGCSRAATALHHEKRRERTEKPNATQVKAIQPAWE